jgi:hypothetical protein
MSECVECSEPMAPMEASENLTCRKCRCGNRAKSAPVRTLARRGTEHTGRPARAPGLLSGVPSTDGTEMGMLNEEDQAG